MNLMKLWFWPNFNDNILNHSVVITNFQKLETYECTKSQRGGQRWKEV